MDKLFFLLQCPFLQLSLLLPPYLHYLSKALLRIFHHFSFPLSLLQVLPLFLFLVLLPILIPCLPLLLILFQTSLSPLYPILYLHLYQALYLLPIPYIGLHLFPFILDLLVFLWDPFLTYTLLFFH